MHSAVAAGTPESQTPETNGSAPAAGDELDMLKIAEEADNATSMDPEQSTPPAAGNGKPETNAKPGADKAQQGKPGEQGKQQDGAKPNDPKAPKPGEPGADSNLTKEQKEEARRDRSWKAFDAEKSAFRQEKQAILSQLEGMKRELAQLKQKPSGPVKDEHGHTAETYERLAKEKENEDPELAQAARERAAKLRQQELAAKQPASAPQTDTWRTPEFQQEWQRNTAEVIADMPELDDPAHPITKAANTLLQDKTWAPFFLSRPDGIRAAVEVAKLLEKSAQIDAANERAAKAEAEVARLTKLTQPRGSHPSAPPSNAPKVPETEEDMLALAREADAGG